jgi:hypothetical protein
MQIFVCVSKLVCPVMGSEATKPKHCLSAQTGTTKMLHQAARIMKLTAIILLGTCLHVYAVGFGQKISLSEKDVPIETVFKKIEQQTNLKFLYAEHVIKDAKKVTVKIKDVLIDEVLKLCFREQPFEYEITDKTIIIKPKAGFTSSIEQALPQPNLIDIKGRVFNENNDPVENVNVTVKGTAVGTSTNANGEFLFKSID